MEMILNMAIIPRNWRKIIFGYAECDMCSVIVLGP